MPLKSLLSALLLALGATACGGGSPDQLTNDGAAALNSGDYVTALDKFGAALEAMQPGDPRYLEAQLGYLRAAAHTDEQAAATEFVAFAAEQGLDYGDYNMMVTDLKGAGAMKEAILVLSAGLERFPDHEKMVELRDRIGKEAEQAGDAQTLAAVKGLGYVGGD